MRSLFIIITIAILLSLFTSCIQLDVTTPEQEDEVSGLINVYSTVQQTLNSFCWGTLTIPCHNNGVAYPMINKLMNNIDTAVVEQINDTIRASLLEYMYEFYDGAYFQLDAQITRLDDKLLSIFYHGEVYTASKGIGGAFALNFDLESGKLLSVSDFISESEVIEALENELFLQKDAQAQDEYEIPPHVAYHLYRVRDNDKDHVFDFFIDNSYFNIIVSISPTSGGYAIYRVELR